jgi:hypothetical protein
MPDRYRIQLYWAPRKESLHGMARRLFDTLGALGESHPLLRRFMRERDEEDVPTATLEDCASALEEGAEAWYFGREERTAYEARLFVGRALSPPLSMTLTCGIEPEHVGGLFAPNRLEMWLRRDAPDELASPERIQAMLVAAASAWDADFGYVGTASLPAAPPPITSLGAPPVGWMTYLSKRLPPPPVTLRSPAVSYPADAGSVVVAHPSLYRDHVKDHREAIEVVAAALDEAGVLKPSVSLDQRPS